MLFLTVSCMKINVMGVGVLGSADFISVEKNLIFKMELA